MYPLLLSVVYVVRNQAPQMATMLREASELLETLVSDFELVVVDNASDDDSVPVLKALIGLDGLPNVQVYALASEVDFDTAFCAGIEHALGDFVAVIDPLQDDLSILPLMLARATQGSDVVYARNSLRAAQGLAYGMAYTALASLYRLVHGIDLRHEAPPYRLMSRSVVNFILQHGQPAIAYRHLPAAGGFTRLVLDYSHAPLGGGTKRLADSIDRGMQLLVSSGRAPMRLVTSLSLFGAVANVLYSIYVLLIAIFKSDVAPGWVSLSLQQSGMFLLISVVLLVLGEYILQMARHQQEGPAYHVGQEFSSARLTRRARLNVEVPQHARQVEVNSATVQ
jgi:glycosyltransferase involved in cell wall biosynthesis